MKTILLSLLIPFCFSAALAQSPSQLPGTLKDTMHEMGHDMKTIASQASNSHLNADSATLCDQFIALVKHAKTFVPDSVASLPPAQKTAALQEFAKQLDHVADLGTQLAAAFRANNTAQISALLNQLLAAKKAGHHRFDP